MLQFTNGFGSIGMLIFAPLSEIYGRARPMFLGLFFFLVLQAPIALAQNLPAIFISRFLTGAAGFSIIAIFPAMTVDLFSSSDRGPAVDLYVLAFNTGPCFGSLAGGFLVDALDWRWTIWIVLILGVVCCSIGFLAISETCEAVLLQRKAAQVRFETKNWAMHSSVDELPITWKMMRQKYMLKPVMMLFRDPIVGYPNTVGKHLSNSSSAIHHHDLYFAHRWHYLFDVLRFPFLLHYSPALA
jgi:DHA1 family multidrug resistance protein-like MFS transporter